MLHSINPGRMRHKIDVTTIDLSSTDEYGNTSSTDVPVFEARANVKVVSGQQLEQYDTAVTKRVISVLTWFKHELTTDMKLTWENQQYDVTNIQPSEDERTMLVTCKIVGKQ